MAVTQYASTAQLQARIGPAETFDAGDGARFGAMLDAVSRMIDEYCYGQFFGRTDSTAREFTARESTRLVLPSMVSVTAVKTDEDGDQSYERTWAAADYVLYPYNAADLTLARPYTEIHVSRATGSAGYAFPASQKGVQITAVWGWPAIPDVVSEVCILETMRLIKSFQAPAGTVSNAEFGSVTVAPALHPSSMVMLRPYKRFAAVQAYG